MKLQPWTGVLRWTTFHTITYELSSHADLVHWRKMVQDFSVWPIRSRHFSISRHFGRNISVHKELMKLVNVKEYLGRTIIYRNNTRQIKDRQFALPEARSKSSAKMIKCSALEIWSKIPSEIRNITCLALFATDRAGLKPMQPMRFLWWPHASGGPTPCVWIVAHFYLILALKFTRNDW